MAPPARPFGQIFPLAYSTDPARPMAMRWPEGTISLLTPEDPPLTWVPITHAHLDAFHRPPAVGIGVGADGSIVLASPYLPCDPDTLARFGAPFPALSEILLRLETFARRPTFDPSQWVSAAASGAIRTDGSGRVPHLAPQYWIGATRDGAPATAARDGDLEVAVWDAITPSLDAETVSRCAALPGGVRRWYTHVRHRPDLADLIRCYPMAWPAFAPAAVASLTDPQTGRFPRRRPGAALLRAAVGHPSHIPVAPVHPGREEQRRRMGERRAALLSPGVIAWCRGPGDVPWAAALHPESASGAVESQQTVQRMLLLHDVLTPDALRRLTTHRDWAALPLLSAAAPLARALLDDPRRFWATLEAAHPAWQYSGAPWPEEDPTAWTTACQQQIYWLAEYYHEHETTPATREALERARSLARVLEILDRAQATAVALALEERLALAAAYPDPFPRPRWVPNDDVLRPSPAIEPSSIVTMQWIATARASAEEGVRMDHCLGMAQHHESAQQGHTAFFHIAFTDAVGRPDGATAEVRVHDGRVVQYFGIGNSVLPEALHQDLLQLIDQAMWYLIWAKHPRGGRSPE